MVAFAPQGRNRGTHGESGLNNGETIYETRKVGEYTIDRITPDGAAIMVERIRLAPEQRQRLMVPNGAFDRMCMREPPVSLNKGKISAYRKGKASGVGKWLKNQRNRWIRRTARKDPQNPQPINRFKGYD